MADHTKIEWCDATVSFWLGCTKVSDGCANCYAEAMAKRGLWKGVEWGPGRPRVQTKNPVAQMLRLDRKAKRLGRRLKVFVNPAADPFDPDAPDAWRDQILAVSALCQDLDVILLTKRQALMREYISHPDTICRIGASQRSIDPTITAYQDVSQDAIWPLSNVWLGVSVENQATADERIPHLLATPAAKRFVSMEPLLGPADLAFSLAGPRLAAKLAAMVGTSIPHDHPDVAMRAALDWVIVGGESGPHARPMHPDWVRSLRDQCQAAGVPFFFKQWGEWHPCEMINDGACYPMYGHGEFDSWKAPVFHHDSKQQWNWRRLGKKTAGRVLDGWEWNEVPE